MEGLRDFNYISEFYNEKNFSMLHKYHLISNITFNLEMSGSLTSYIYVTESILYFFVTYCV